MPGVTIDGNDVLAVFETSGKAIKRARTGGGPALIECKTYRWRGHHEGDPNRGGRYRSAEEIEGWMKKCPVRRFEEKLLKKKILTPGRVKAIQEETEKEIDEAIAFARESPFPDPQDLYEDVYVE
jgi:pyruvate dehydrogenase E1 component alpha subunit